MVFSSLSRIIYPLNDSYTLNFEQYLRQLSWELSAYEGLHYKYFGEKKLPEDADNEFSFDSLQ